MCEKYKCTSLRLVLSLPILPRDFAAAPVRRQGRGKPPSLDCARLRGFFLLAGWEEKMVGLCPIISLTTSPQPTQDPARWG